MLLDPASAVSPAPIDDAPSASATRAGARSRKPPLTRVEAVQADARTVGILEAHGIAFRPAQETSLVELATGAVYSLAETLERPIFAAQLRRRAAAMALSFDAFRQGNDLGNLRLVGLRPSGGKASPGTLAQALASFARDYDRRVGRLVTAGTIRPVLSVIHIRYDVGRHLWDIHAHALWDVPDDKVETALMGLGVKFFDKWIDGDRAERPGAAANYCLSWAIDHRQIMEWPEAAVLELWNLPRIRLMRPAGEFRVFRRSLEGKVVRREGGRVVVEERPDPGPRRKAAKRPGPAVGGGRVVAITKARIERRTALCAVVKGPRMPPGVQSTASETSEASRTRAREDLASGEYRGNSPPTGPAAPPPLASVPSVPRPPPPPRWVRGNVRAALNALPVRRQWMRKAWPPRSPGRLPCSLARRLAATSEDPPALPHHGCRSRGRPPRPG